MTTIWNLLVSVVNLLTLPFIIIRLQFFQKFPDLRFKYVEEDRPEEFFIPYVWSLVYNSSNLYFNSERIKLFWRGNVHRILINALWLYSAIILNWATFNIILLHNDNNAQDNVILQIIIYRNDFIVATLVMINSISDDLPFKFYALWIVNMINIRTNILLPILYYIPTQHVQKKLVSFGLYHFAKFNNLRY